MKPFFSRIQKNISELRVKYFAKKIVSIIFFDNTKPNKKEKENPIDFTDPLNLFSGMNFCMRNSSHLSGPRSFVMYVFLFHIFEPDNIEIKSEN